MSKKTVNKAADTRAVEFERNNTSQDNWYKRATEAGAAKKIDFPAIKKTVLFMMKIAWKEKKSLYFLYLLKFVADALGEMKNLFLPALLINELKLIIDGESLEMHIHQSIIYVVITLLAEFISSGINQTANALINIDRQWFDRYFMEQLCAKSMNMDFQYTEDPVALDVQNKAKEGMGWYSGGVVGIIDTFYYAIYNIVLLCTVVTIIALYCPLLLPVQVLAMVAVMFFEIRSQKIRTNSFLKQAKSNRIFGYFLYRLSDFRFGKDIRMYDSAHMMNSRTNEFAGLQVDAYREQSEGTARNQYGSDTANALRDGISYLYMGIRAIRGFIDIGEFTMCVTAASRLYQSMLNIGERFTQLVEKCTYAHRYLIFDEYPAAKEYGTRSVKDGTHTIEFKDVSFKYPRAEEYVLEHVNITIRPDEHLSVVGLNGAGKTTFIKLLCRLYDVTDGQILVDGVDIREYSKAEYRKLFSVVFQDFKLFAFSLRDNIEMGDVDEACIERGKKENHNNAADAVNEKVVEDVHEEKLIEVLKLSGLYEDAMKLDNGLDTTLFKSFDQKGTDLSGGQQQKTAISRALYRNSPIVILDEPTAALDPIAEYEIYRKFDTLVGNKSAIYISHRLSSCKFCDRIAVFADKTIKEYGTHDELVKKPDGIYAEMFRTQAQYYIDNAIGF